MNELGMRDVVYATVKDLMCVFAQYDPTKRTIQVFFGLGEVQFPIEELMIHRLSTKEFVEYVKTGLKKAVIMEAVENE
jgi:hypothetical protein